MVWVETNPLSAIAVLLVMGVGISYIIVKYLDSPHKRAVCRWWSLHMWSQWEYSERKVEMYMSYRGARIQGSEWTRTIATRKRKCLVCGKLVKKEKVL